MNYRFSIFLAWGSVPFLLLLQGCTPSVTPGFYGGHSVSSKALWDFPGEKTLPDGVLYYPSADASTIDPAAAPCPVIVFIPGYLEPPLSYRSYGEQAASWGYVVLIARFFWLFDDQAEEDTLRLIQWLRRQNDQGGVLAGMLDTERLGVAGHSIGGKYALAAALNEPSVGAVVAIDPVDGCAEILPPTRLFRSFTPELMPQVKVPTCILGAEFSGLLNPRSENYHEFFRYASCQAEEVLVYKADHASFVDDYASLFQDIHDLIFGGQPTNDNRAKSVSARYMISWFNVFLRGQDEFWTYLTGEQANQDVASGLVSITTNFGARPNEIIILSGYRAWPGRLRATLRARGWCRVCRRCACPGISPARLWRAPL